MENALQWSDDGSAPGGSFVYRGDIHGRIVVRKAMLERNTSTN